MVSSQKGVSVFIDYLTMIMINMVGGTVLLAYYIWRGIDEADQRPYAAAFFGVGLLALVSGLHLSFTWPLPGSYNVGYGEATTLFGIVFLSTALALWNGWNLLPVAIYAFFAGVDAIVVGARILSLGLTKEPLISAVGFILAGLGGVAAAPFFLWFRDNRTVRLLAIGVLLLTAAIWAVTFYGSLWGHLESFGEWLPATMRGGQ
jgi:putative membrane protein